MKSDARSLTRLDLALIAAVMLLAIFARALPGPRTIDDAFITFRYSRNIIEGQGFVYNPGSRVLGTTTPLFTLLMAAISAIVRGQDFQWYAIAVSALADAGTCAFLYLLAYRLTRNRAMATLLSGLWAIAPWSVTFAVGGMETSLNIFWMAGATWWFVSDHPVWMGTFAGLGLFTRIDDLLWIGPLFAYQVFDQWWKVRNHRLAGGVTAPPTVGQREPIVSAWRAMLGTVLKTWLAFGVVLLPWVIFATLYFGSPVPNSLMAKTLAYHLPPGSALGALIPIYSTLFAENETFGGQGAMVFGLIYLTLTGFGLLFAARRLPRLLPLLIYPWLYLAAFAIANPLIFRWYLAPPLPPLMLGVVSGVWSLIEALQRALARTDRRPLATGITVGLFAILWTGTSLNGWIPTPDHEPFRPAPKAAWHKIELLYQQVGTALRDKCGVQAKSLVVAAADVGAVGYFSYAKIIDTVGLVTPGLGAYYPVPTALISEGQNYAIPPQLIIDTQPMYLVAMEAFVRQGLEQDSAFKATYQKILEIPTDYYGTGMRVYARVNAADLGCMGNATG